MKLSLTTMDGELAGEWDLTDYGYGFIEKWPAQRALIDDMLQKIKHAKALQSLRALERYAAERSK